MRALGLQRKNTRNMFLLPRKLAIEANAANKAVIEQMKAAAVRRSAKEKSEAEELSKQFDGLEVKFARKSGENDQLFGSVTSGDIAEALNAASITMTVNETDLVAVFPARSTALTVRV